MGRSGRAAGSLLAAGVLLLACPSGSRSSPPGGAGALLAATPRFTVIPPGPVTARARVELRLAVPNPGAASRTLLVEFYDGEQRHARQVVVAPPNGHALARAWWCAAGREGKRRLRARLEGRDVGRPWSLQVLPEETPAPPYFTAGWLDALALAPGVYGRSREPQPRDVNATLDMMKSLGMTTAIFTYVEYQGHFFYPSRLRFYDRDRQREAVGERFSFDVVGTVLARAEKNGMRVFLGLGRGGDSRLLWEFEKPGWEARNREAVELSCRVARELWERYGRHRSLYGWYLTHEMNDLARASAYYNPVVEYCRSLAPDMPVLCAPAGTPLIDRDTLARSKVDIFAYQDAVGSGYVPYRNTWDPENRLRMLDEVFSRYQRLHAGTEKHFWADLELWEMDGSQGYGGAYPASFARVRRQLEIQARYAEQVTAYEVFGFLEPPRSDWPTRDRRAATLYRDYRRYLRER